jgi:hypothetical protein
MQQQPNVPGEYFVCCYELNAKRQSPNIRLSKLTAVQQLALGDDENNNNLMKKALSYWIIKRKENPALTLGIIFIPYSAYLNLIFSPFVIKSNKENRYITYSPVCYILPESNTVISNVKQSTDAVKTLITGFNKTINYFKETLNNSAAPLKNFAAEEKNQAAYGSAGGGSKVVSNNNALFSDNENTSAETRRAPKETDVGCKCTIM